LSNMNIDIPACFRSPFAWTIFPHFSTANKCLSLTMRWISDRQQIVRSCFLIQSVVHVFWLRSLTFRVIIKRYVVIPVILLVF
jgi:hypothetical protein